MGPYRVVQWATGKVGRRALAAIIDHPELELVGVYVHSLDKVGVDAGQLAGAAETGVHATDDVAVLLAERPDCVSFMAAQLDVEIVEAFCEAVERRHHFERVPDRDELRPRVARTARCCSA